MKFNSPKSIFSFIIWHVSAFQTAFHREPFHKDPVFLCSRRLKASTNHDEWKGSRHSTGLRDTMTTAANHGAASRLSPPRPI